MPPTEQEQSRSLACRGGPAAPEGEVSISATAGSALVAPASRWPSSSGMTGALANGDTLRIQCSQGNIGRKVDYDMESHTVLHPAATEDEVYEAISAVRSGTGIATGKALVYIAQAVRAHYHNVLAVRIEARYSDGAEDVILNSWDVDLCTSDRDENDDLWNDELDLVDAEYEPLRDLDDVIDQLSSILEPLEDGAVLIAPTYAPVYFHSEAAFLEWFAVNPPSQVTD